MRERIGDGPWVDITQWEIERKKRTIAVYEGILKKIRAQLDGKSRHRLSLSSLSRTSMQSALLIRRRRRREAHGMCSVCHRWKNA
jgi:hypothetical protein